MIPNPVSKVVGRGLDNFCLLPQGGDDKHATSSSILQDFVFSPKPIEIISFNIQYCPQSSNTKCLPKSNLDGVSYWDGLPNGCPMAPWLQGCWKRTDRGSVHLGRVSVEASWASKFILKV